MTKNYKLFLATDHAGFALKEYLKTQLQDAGYDVEDCGALVYDKGDDYPDFIKKAAVSVQSTPNSRAIILGHSGQGEAMVANRHRGVRAAVFYGGATDIITLSREHNDANILSLGAGFVTFEEAWNAVQTWLVTEFSTEERHARRISKIDDSR